MQITAKLRVSGVASMLKLPARMASIASDQSCLARMICKTSLVLILVAINGFFVAAEFALVKLSVQETR
jgi:hypothetical protein